MTESMRSQIRLIVEQISSHVLKRVKTSSPVSEVEAESAKRALAEATERQDTAFFRALVEEEKKQSAKSGDFEAQVSLLMAAAFSGQASLVERLLAAGANPNFKQDYFFIEFDALSLAADRGHTEVVQQLIQAGANPDGLNGFSRPLTKAVQAGQLEMAQLLIELGADPNVDGLTCNDTLLITAAGKGHTDVVQLLLSLGADISKANNFNETALGVACAKADIATVQALIAAGADLDKPGRDGLPPLLIVANAPWRRRMIQKQIGLDDGETIEDIDERATQVVEQLLSAGADPNVTGSSGTTALVIAASQGLAQMVEMLLIANADVNVINDRDNARSTPLIAAIKENQTEIVKILLNMGADHSQPNGQGLSPLELATRAGLSEIVALLRSHGAKPNEQKDIHHALIGAARCGDVAGVQRTIQAGADVDIDDRGFPAGGLTPLMYAAAGGHTKVVAALIEAGADVNRHDARQLPWHKTPLMYAAEKNNADVVALLLKAGAETDASDRVNKPGRTALIYAAIEKHLKVIRLLLKAGADVTLTERKGNTAFHYLYDCAEMVRELLAAGANPYLQGSEDPPIVLAALMERSNVVRWMLACEPTDIEQAQRARIQALDWAASNGDTELAKTLAAVVGDINVRSSRGVTPLIRAVIHSDFDMVEALVNLGADVNATDDEGRNPLFLAIERGHLDIAEWLLEQNACLVETKNICDLLFSAVQQGTDAIKLLIRLGVDINACDEDGETALSIAATLRSPEIMKLLIEHGADLEKHGPFTLERAIDDEFPEIVALLENAGVNLR